MNFDEDIVGWLDDIGWFACFDGAWLFSLRSWKTVNQVAAGAQDRSQVRLWTTGITFNFPISNVKDS